LILRVVKGGASVENGFDARDEREVEDVVADEDDDDDERGATPKMEASTRARRASERSA
jgi:hypothetical protein